VRVAAELTGPQLDRLATWVRSHGVDAHANFEDGYVVIYSELVHEDGRTERECDRARSIADARAILGY
jgi:hypothetical protein